MDLSIIIITHNSATPVVECLRSLREHPPSGEYETFVIDNVSSDGTPAIIEERFPEVRLVANTDNRGYSRGVNQGITLSGGRRILILNPDIVLTEGAIDTLSDFMERTPDAGIVASKLIYSDGTLQQSCRTFYNLKILLLRRTFLGKLFPNAPALRRHLMSDYDHMETRKVDWVIGACMMVRREAMERVGKMDERFFLYFEDIDWCFRMKNRGLAVYYIPDSVMIHRYERSSARSVINKPFVFHMLSMLRYYEKWNKLFYFFRRHRSTLKTVIFVLSDLVAINVCFFVSYHLRNLVQPLFVNKLYPMSWYGFFILFSNLIYMLTFLFSGLYRIRRETPWMEELLRFARVIFLGLVILMASTYLTRVRIFSRAVVLGQAGLTLVAIMLLRRGIRRVHRELIKASFDLKRVLLAGGEEEVRAFSERIVSSREIGFDLVGTVTDGPDSLGTMDNIVDIVERFRVQEVIVFPPAEPDKAMLRALGRLKDRMIQLRIVSPMAGLIRRDVRIEEIAGCYVFSLERGSLLYIRRFLKRLGDMSTAIVLLPIVLFLSAVYHIYGTITRRVRFFEEIRLGEGGRRFAWPRAVTVRGSEASDLCKIRLLIQLLAGRVSLVGPPAPRPSWSRNDAADFRPDLKPGITGRWRVPPFRERSAALGEESIEYQRWSLTGEMMVLIQSMRSIFSGHYPHWYFQDGRDT